jgi:hypothetical protein
MKRETNEYKAKCFQIAQAKSAIETEYDSQMRSFKTQFEIRQKEIEEMQTKLVPHMDNELLRIKLVNEIEGPHRAQLELKQTEIEKLSNENFTLKRNLDNIKNE